MQYHTRESGMLIPARLQESGAQREMRERIAELEFTSGNDDGTVWLPMSDGAALEFSRGFVADISRLARIMYLKNPLIARGVNVIADYVYSRPPAFDADDEDVNAVIQAFLDDPINQTEFTSHIARIQLDRELRINGNIFFAMVPHEATGRVRMHSLPADQITEIITDPNNAKRHWYYKRDWFEVSTDLATGERKETKRSAYYRDWRFQGDDRTKIGSIDIVAGVYVYHIKTGGFSDWKFGMSEIYAALDWAKAYKGFLENWSTIVQAYARFAFKMTVSGGTQGVRNAKAKLGTTLGVGTGRETNPPPNAASVFVAGDGNDLQPIKTSGATTSAEDGRRLLLMVASTFGLPETFFGDVSVGTLATATSLDRPTELMVSNRQELWRDVFMDIITFVVEWAIRAPDGDLRGYADIEQNEWGEMALVYVDTAPKITITFPSVVEKDMQSTIAAIVQGTTLDGKTPKIVPDLRIVARMVLTALGERDIDEMIDTLFPDDESALVTPPTPAQPPTTDPNAPQPSTSPDAPPSPDAQLAQATEALRSAITHLAETVRGGPSVEYANYNMAVRR